MNDGDFQTAISLLERHYGRIDVDAYRQDWRSCVRFILERQWPPTKFAKIYPDLQDTWLNDVADVAACRREELWEFLQLHGCSATLVAFLHKLAQWWQNQIDQGRDPLESPASEFQRSDCDTDSPASTWQRVVARQDRGLAARLACVVFGSRQFPITRGIWRVACRHSWMAWHDDPTDATGYFDVELAKTPASFAQATEWLTRVGEDFCGAKPKCESCPLMPLLGTSGPCEPDADGP